MSGTAAALETPFPAARGGHGNAGWHRGAASTVSFGARRIEVARRLLSGCGLPADAVAAQAQLCIPPDRRPFRLSGGVRGDAAGTLVAGPGDHYLARHRGAALPRPAAAAADDRGPPARDADLLGVRIAQASRDNAGGGRRQDHGSRSRRRYGQVSSPQPAGRATTAWP